MARWQHGEGCLRGRGEKGVGGGAGYGGCKEVGGGGGKCVSMKMRATIGAR